MKLNKINMKSNLLFVIFLSSLLFFIGCGKPNDSEQIGDFGNYKIVQKLSTPGYAQDITIDDKYAYICQGEGGLVILNIENPQNPIKVSQISEGVRGYSAKILRKDTIIFIAAGDFGITVLNISNRSNPIVISSNLNMKPAKNINIYGNYLFTAVSEQGVKIANISNPSEPDIRGTINTTGYARGSIVSSDTNKLFVACGEMGLSIFDIDDFQDGYPSTNLLAWYDTPGYAEDVVIDDSKSLAFIASGYFGLQIIDYSDIANIRIVGYGNINGGYAKDIIRDRNLVYIACQKNGLQIFDVSIPSAPVLIGYVETKYAQGLTQDENYIYVVDEEEGLIVISKPK